MNTAGHMICIVLLVMAATVFGTESDKTGLRTWTSRSGQTIDAAFEKMQYGMVYLRKKDSQIVTIRKSTLSQEDQEMIGDLIAASASAMSAKKGTQTKKGKAPDALYQLFGSKLKNAKKKSVSVDEIAGKTIGVYFSADWCPPCRAFTPKLVKFYNLLKKQGKPFEIVFVSSDRDRSAMYQYMKELRMPWLALTYGDKHKKSLSAKYNVRGIPKLVILSCSGELITENGRGDVMGGGVSVFDKWNQSKQLQQSTR